MGTAIAKQNGKPHEIPKGSRLHKSERELAAAMADQYEAFYRQGVILERIKDDKEYVDGGFTSFDQYMNERMPLGIKKTHAWCLIAAKNIRPLLPDLDSASAGSMWTEYAIRPLTHKDFTKKDVRTIGKKIASHVRKGELLTAPLVKSICDDYRGVTTQRKKKKDEETFGTDTASDAIKKMTKEVNLWQLSLEKFSGEMWEEAEVDAPGCVDELIQALSGLASYLRT